MPPSGQYVPVHPVPVLPPARRGRGWIGWVLFIALAVALFLSLQANRPDRPGFTLSRFATELEAGNVSEVEVGQDSLRGKFNKPIPTRNGGTTTTFGVELGTGTGHTWGFVSWLLAIRNGADVRMVNDQNLLAAILIPLIPWLLIFAFIWFFVFRQLRNQRAGQPPVPVYLTPPVLPPTVPQPPSQP